jgi:hypothetical protein
MDNLPVRKIPGIGQVMERVLKEIGVQSCKDVRDPEHVRHRFSSLVLPTHELTAARFALNHRRLFCSKCSQRPPPDGSSKYALRSAPLHLFPCF